MLEVMPRKLGAGCVDEDCLFVGGTFDSGVN
jgi:hypothetical protein